MDYFGQTIEPFDKIIDALLDPTTPFPPIHLHRFSDLSPNDLEKLQRSWGDIRADRRLALLEDLEELADSDTLVSFDDLSKFALDDPDPRVREVALRLLWENSEVRLVDKFLKMIDTDPDVNVRSTAATALGQFIYYGELEEIPEKTLHRIENKLLSITTDEQETKQLRRRALEAMGFSSRPEIKNLILKAYNSNDTEWLVTALFAMGRSANEAWIPSVVEMLDSENEEVLFEAVRAAGELEAGKARQTLIRIVKNQPSGSDIRLQGIWALSKIGGGKVRATLEALLELSEDDNEIDVLEDAIDNLHFTENFHRLAMMDYIPESEEEILQWALDGDLNIFEDEDEDEDDEEEEFFDDENYGDENFTLDDEDERNE